MKLIALDMDGTLLNRHSVISARNADAIRNCEASGNRVIIATGRSESDARLLLTNAGLILPVISSNGAQVRDENHVLLSTVPLPPEFTRTMLAFTEEQAVYTELFDLAVTFHTADARRLLEWEYTARRETDADFAARDAWEWAERQLGQHSLVPADLRAKAADPAVTPLKILTFSFRPDALATLSARLETWAAGGGMEEIVVSQSCAYNLEFTHRDAQKGIALERMAQRYGIPMHQTVAIGDSPNDLSMFAVAGHSIAMADAAPSIQERCDRITHSSDEDGVAYALESLIAD